MSVEIQGVQGYDYQYLATVYLSLLYIENDNVKIFVEDTEDAKILFDKDDVQFDILLQVKKHNKSIAFKELCEWLIHFGKRQADEFLLSKLAHNINSYSVFISSGRCEDKISTFIRYSDFDKLFSELVFSRDFLNDLKKEMKEFYKEQTRLVVNRKECVNKFFCSAKDDEVKNALRRISILENFEYDNLKEKISATLNNKFIIRISDINDVVNLLVNCVREGRDTGNDIATKIKDILLKYTQKVLPYDDNYIEYLNQSIYEEELEKNNVLLLTGIPFCGKTYIAKSIAQKYAQKGFEVLQTNEFSGDYGANSFLNSYANDQRILLLEDPFGSIILKENKTELLELYRKLILEKALPNRKIIITSRKDIVLALFQSQSIDKCRINQFSWKDHTLSNLQFAKIFWLKLYGDTLESLEYFQKIQNHIAQNESGIFLEIGEISTLYKQYPSIEKLKTYDLNTIIKDARISSNVIVDKIDSFGQDAINVFILLGFCCSTIRCVLQNELAYVLSDSQENPAIVEKRTNNRCVLVSLGSRNKKTEIQFPLYSEDYKIDKKYITIFRDFEKYGYISRNRLSREIQFTHPTFYYASKLMCLKELNDTWDNSTILKMGRHAISALDKSVNLSGLEMLWFCFGRKCVDNDKILNLIFSSLNSIFPATKDKAILLLEICFKELNTDNKKTLVDTISEFKFDKYVLWHNDEPWLNLSDNIEVNAFPEIYCDLFGTEPPANLDDIKLLISGEKKVLPKMIYDILKSKIKDDLPIEILDYAMTYDETIIRENAIYLIFKNHAFKTSNISKYLLNFDNYNVIVELFKGAINAWFLYSIKDQKLILNYFKTHLNRISIAIRSEDFLENFSDENRIDSLDWSSYDKKQKKVLWELWCEVFTEFLYKFPAKFISIDQVHMEYTMEQMTCSVKNQTIIFKLIKAWNYWLENYSLFHSPDDYGMSVLDLLVKYISSKNTDREDLFEKMLSCKNTNIATSHITHAINNWALLSEKEKKILISVFGSDRIDIKWLKAVSLTRENVPLKLQITILGQELFNKTIQEIVTVLRDCRLLEECINVYCGFPGPLWYNGYDHEGSELWNKIIEEILHEEFLDIAFEISLREFIGSQYDSQQRFHASCEKIWESLLNNDKKRHKTFETLLYVTVSNSQTNKALWDKYWGKATLKEKESNYTQLALTIELIECNQVGEKGILDLFEYNLVFNELYSRLENDKVIKDLCDFYLKAYPKTKNVDFLEKEYQIKQLDDLKKNFKIVVKILYQSNPPRMQLTNFIVKYTMRTLEFNSEEILQLLEKRRRELIRSENKYQMDFEDKYTLDNWNN